MIKPWLLFLVLILAGFTFSSNASASWKCSKWDGDVYCIYIGGPGPGPPPP